MYNQIQIDDILKSLREQIGTQAQEIAVLKATIDALTKPKQTTTASPVLSKENGPQGI
jgi:hypothetical protein